MLCRAVIFAIIISFIIEVTKSSTFQNVFMPQCLYDYWFPKVKLLLYYDLWPFKTILDLKGQYWYKEYYNQHVREVFTKT